MRWFGDVVRRADSRVARVPVVELPGDHAARRHRRRLDVDHAGRTEVRPGELLGARPHQLHRLAGRVRQPRRLDGDLAAVLAAVARSHVGHDDADAILGDAKGAGQLGSHAERPLRTCPDGEPAVHPFGDGRARLERHVRDVRNPITGVERSRGLAACARDIADVERRCAAPAAASGRLLQVLEDGCGRGLVRRACHCARIAAAARRAVPLVRRDHADELAVAHDVTPAMARAALSSTETSVAPYARRADDAPVQHARASDVRRVLVAAGHDRAAVDLLRRRARDRPCARARRAASAGRPRR